MNLIKMTSISKKILLASVGAFLVVFLLLHLAINLCLLRNDGGSWYLAASHFMGTNYIIKVFEVVLMLAVLIHICLAILLQIQNWRSRPVRYKVRTKSKTSFMSRYMIWSGGLVLCFLGIHFVNFYFVKLDLKEGKYLVEVKHVEEYLGDTYSKLENQQEAMAAYSAHVTKVRTVFEKGTPSDNGEYIKNLEKKDIEEGIGADFKKYEPDFYTMCIHLFQQKGYSFLYIFFFIAIGFHLYHAFRSMFQTFGLNHNKYNRTIKYAGLIYSLAISVGFSVIPMYFMFFYKG